MSEHEQQLEDDIIKILLSESPEMQKLYNTNSYFHAGIHKAMHVESTVNKITVLVQSLAFATGIAKAYENMAVEVMNNTTKSILKVETKGMVTFEFLREANSRFKNYTWSHFRAEFPHLVADEEKALVYNVL